MQTLATQSLFNLMAHPVLPNNDDQLQGAEIPADIVVFPSKKDRQYMVRLNQGLYSWSESTE